MDRCELYFLFRPYPFCLLLLYQYMRQRFCPVSKKKTTCTVRANWYTNLKIGSNQSTNLLYRCKTGPKRSDAYTWHCYFAKISPIYFSFPIVTLHVPCRSLACAEAPNQSLPSPLGHATIATMCMLHCGLISRPPRAADPHTQAYACRG